MDNGDLRYFEDEKSSIAKKNLVLTGAKSFIQEKTEFMDNQKTGKAEKGDEWSEPNQKFRVGIELTGRKMKPVYFYSASCHDAKFLQCNIDLFGQKEKADEIKELI
jgi:hypothetical protein